MENLLQSNTKGTDIFRIIDQMDDALFILNMDWNFAYLNEAARKQLFQNKRSLLGKNIWLLFPELMDSRIYWEAQKAVLDKSVRQYEEYHFSRGVLYHVKIDPSSDGLSFSFRDISGMKEEWKEQMQHYQLLFEIQPDAVFSLDTSGRFTRVNIAAQRLTGYSAGELENMSYRELTHSESIPSMARYFNETMKGSPQTYVQSIRHKNGHFIQTQVTSVPIIVKGRVVGEYRVVHDITQWNQTLAELEETKYKYNTIVEHTQDIMCFCDPKGMLTYISPAVFTMLGYSPEELIGKKAADLIYKEDIDDMPHTSKNSRKENKVFTARIRHKNGSYRWYETTYKSIVNEDDQVLYFLAIGRDVTHRKDVEEALRKSKDNLKYAQKIARFGHWDVDLVQDEVFWSDEMYRILGIESKGERSLHLYLSLVHPEDRRYVKRQYFDAVRNGKAFDIEYRHQLQDGSVRMIHSICDIDYDESGKTIRVFGTMQDITSQKETEEMLLKSEKLSVVGQLAAGVAHEIRNPLTSLKGFIQLLRSNAKDMNQNYFDIMDSELNRIEFISNELLVLAKPQAAEFHVHEVASILDSVIALLESEAHLSDVEFLVEYEDDLPRISCNENQMKQVFVNIVKNGMEAMPEGGQLEVRVMRSGTTHIVIEIVDHGKGIPEEVLNRLGEPFYTTKSKGTGLGLMVTSKIVENHKGKISYFSQIGQGTKVSITLPILKSGTIQRFS